MCFSKSLRRTESNEIGLYLDVLVWLFPLGIATIEADFHGRWQLPRRDGLVH